MPDIGSLESLSTWLGRHRELQPGQLTEREAASLVMFAGRAARFIVRTEVQVPVTLECGYVAKGEMDVGWFDPDTDQLLAAWEIDGRDADQGHILGVRTAKKKTPGIKGKFDACNAPLRIHVLYSVKNNLEPKRPSRRSEIESWLGSSAVVVTDEELMSDKGVLRWVRQAESIRNGLAQRSK